MAGNWTILHNDHSGRRLATKSDGEVATTYQDAEETSRPKWSDENRLMADSQYPHVVVIGGGFMGLNIALQLAQKARDANQHVNIALLEANRIGFGASGRSGGHIDESLEPPEEMLTKVTQHIDGLEEKLTALGESGPAKVFETIERYKINCMPKKEYAYKDWEQGGKLIHDDEGQFGSLEPYPYVQGLAAAASNLGVRIYENTLVTNIIQAPDGRFQIETPHGTITTHAVEVAAGPTTETIPLFRDIARSRTVNLPVSTIVTDPLPENVRVAILGEHGRKMLAGAEEENPNQDAAFWHFDASQRLIFGVGISTTDKVNTKPIAEEMDRIFPQLKPAYKRETGQDLTWRVHTENQNLDYCASWMPHVASFSLDNNGRLRRDPNGNIGMTHGFGGYGVTLTAVIADGIAEKILAHRSGRQVPSDNAAVLFSQVAQEDLPIADGPARSKVKEDIAGETAKDYTVISPAAPSSTATAQQSALAATGTNTNASVTNPSTTGPQPNSTPQTPSAAAAFVDPDMLATYVAQNDRAIAAGHKHYSRIEFEAAMPHLMRTNFNSMDIQSDGIRLDFINGARIVARRDRIEINGYDTDNIRFSIDSMSALWGNRLELGENDSADYKRLATAVAQARGVTILNYTPNAQDRAWIDAEAQNLKIRFDVEDRIDAAPSPAFGSIRRPSGPAYPGPSC